VPKLSDDKLCSLCGHELTGIAVGKGEVRPVFEAEKEWYRGILQSEGKDHDVWLPGGLVFYYRGSIIVGGEKVFRVMYDEANRKWGIKFFKKYRDKIPKLRGSDETLCIEANLQTLEAAELESLDFIKQTFDEHNNYPKGVSFSGGKDSAVVLYLVRQLHPNIDVIYLNTTIDYPETERYVKELQQEWGFNLIEVKPARDFFDLSEELGPPSQYMRWCCKTTKFAPLNRLIEERYGTTIMMANGIRKNESYTRKEYARIQTNDIIPKQILMFPILEWNSLLVWLYTFWKKIPINEAYLSGRSRIGCWACPERRPKEFNILERTHPQLYNKLGSLLRKYAETHEIYDIEEWIQTGKWRFRASKYKKKYIKARKLCSTYNQELYNIIDKAKMPDVIEFMKVFGDVIQFSSVTKIKNHNLDISFIGRNIRVSFYDSSLSLKKRFEQVLEKALNCIGCGACIGSCKKGALSIQNNKLRISSKCNFCLECTSSNGLRKGCIALNYKKNQIGILNH